MTSDHDTVLTGAVPEEQMERFSAFVAEKVCLYFPKQRWPELLRGARAAATAFGLPSVDKFIDWLLASPLTQDEVDVLAGHLTIGETYFFRDTNSFDALTNDILPALVEARRKTDKRLRIWSAGCCTGEEAYSLAIMVCRAIPDIEDWHVTILGADINRTFLKKAEKGVYSAWSFRDVPDWLRTFYFSQNRSGGFEIARHIRRMVTFMPLNLAADSYPSFYNGTNAMDLILCRNVMMYFSPEQVAKVVDRLNHCLVDGGWLLVGPSEVSDTVFSHFETVRFNETTFYRRSRPPARSLAETTPRVLRSRPQTAQPSEPQPFDLAMALFEEGRYADTTELLSKYPQDERCMPLLARSLANEGRLTEAMAVSDKLAAERKSDPGTHFLRANILHESGMLDESAREYVRTLFLDPSFALAHFALGNVCNQRGHHADAKRHFRNAGRVLTGMPKSGILPESDGVTAGRLIEIINALDSSEEALHDD